MMKPSVMSVGIGMGVLMLGGSGIAIPSLWSRAHRVENERDKLTAALHEAQDARQVGDDALPAVKQQLAELQRQVEADRELLDAAQENKRELTNQLAETQTRNRELVAASGTLDLRDQEVAALLQQLEQLRADHASLLAQRDAAAQGDPPQLAAGTVAADDLVPVPPKTMLFREPAPSKSLTTAKPAASEPLRFDDRGWKSVAPGAAANAVYGIPQIDYGITIPTTVVPASSAAVSVP